MEMNKVKSNYWQDVRKINLEKTAQLIKEYGGYGTILNDMNDFLNFLAFEFGCSRKIAKEYVETVRGAAIFRNKQMKEKEL